jgi:hypothetical protein
MRPCCPPGHGCNAPDGDEPCLLALCEAAADEEPDAALAVVRWRAWRAARERQRSNRERRFRLRSYERERDRALVPLLMRAQAAAGAGDGVHASKRARESDRRAVAYRRRRASAI